MQRNHGALKAALRQLLSSGVLGSHRGLPVTAIVTMSVQQIEDETGVVITASDGMVPIRDALRMAEHAHPVLAVGGYLPARSAWGIDHHGRPLHLGRAKRLASSDQRLALIAASHGCTRPGCDAPATLTAVHHITEWKDGGPTDISTRTRPATPATRWCTRDPAAGKRESHQQSRSIRAAPTGSRPPHIDPDRTPRVNHRHHLGDLLAAALAHYRARRDTELREHRRRWLREPAGDAGGGDGPLSHEESGGRGAFLRRSTRHGA